MSLSQFHCTSRLYLDMHGLIFETSICYWQDQPGSPCWTRGEGGTPERPPSPERQRVLFLRGAPRAAAGTDRGPKLERERWRRFRLLLLLFERVRETSCLPEEPPRERGGAPGVNRGTPDPAAGSVGGPLGQTGRLGLATEAFGREAGRRGGLSRGSGPACTGLRGHGGEPAGRRNHPPKHRGWWGPSDGGSRMPIGQK